VRYHLDCGCCLRYPGQSAVGRRYADVYQPPAGHLSFLKDPVLVNAIFLKKPERIEALGLILVLSLLLWRLIELSMRQYLEQNQTELPGWDNKPTTRPTTFMMTTKFQGIQVLKLGQRRWLARKLSEVHKLYLAALGLTSLVSTQVASIDASPSVQFHKNGCPISNRHAREGGHPAFSSGFPPQARGNDARG
jgi:hypothetical protein